MKALKFGLAGSVLLLGAVAANVQASVIYNWYDVSSDPDVGPITASIAFDESIWSMGGTFVYNSSPGSATYMPYFGVNSINFAATTSAGFTDPIELSKSTCGQHVPPGQDPAAYCAAIGLAPSDAVVNSGDWNFNLVFGEFLQGSMLLNDFSTSVGMSSQGTLFTIDQMGSDSPGSCYFKPSVCAGGTGGWKLQVSEPDTVLLLALGLIPLAVAQRRRMAKGRTLTV